MPKFKDRDERTWLIELDAPTVHKVRSDTCGVAGCRHRPLVNAQCEGVDLWDVTGKSFQRMELDTVLMVDVLWLVCEEVAIANDITERQFAKRIGGDVLPSAVAALLEASIESLDPTKRQFLQRAAATRHKHEELALERALEKIEDPETAKRLLENLDERLEETLRQRLTLLSSATDTQASSESAPVA